MDVLIDFFAVRPVFTLYGLRILWVAYLLNEVLPFATLLGNAHNLSAASAGPLIAIFLHACLNIALFRLLIEVAATILSARASATFSR